MRLTGLGMRRVGIAVVVAALAGSAVAAQAAPEKKKHAKPKQHIRVQTFKYTGGCAVDVAGASADPATCVVGANYTILRTSLKEKYLTVQVTDSSGRQIWGQVWTSTGSSTPGGDKAQNFCGGLKNFTMAASSYPMDLGAAVDPSCPGVPTSGTIKVTYSYLPLK